MSIVNFIKKQSVGFYLTIISLIVTIVAMCLFFTVDPTFKSFLKGTYVAPYMVCTIIAMIIEVATIVISQFSDRFKNKTALGILFIILHIAAAVLICEGLIQMIWSGVYETAMALGSQLGDHETAYFFVAVVVVALCGAIISMVSSFFAVVKHSDKTQNEEQ